jgi:hypothetical protein
MAISRNPDERPQLDSAKDTEARGYGMMPIEVICDTPEDEPDDPDTPPISFFAYSAFIPRKGEFLLLQDGKHVRVKDVYYKCGNAGKTHFTALFPLVYAELCEPGENLVSGE